MDRQIDKRTQTQAGADIFLCFINPLNKYYRKYKEQDLNVHINKHTDNQTYRQKDRWIDRQIIKHTDKQR